MKNKTNPIKALIKEEVMKALKSKKRNKLNLTEAKKVTEKDIFAMYDKQMVQTLKANGFKKKLSPQDLRALTIQWLISTYNEDHMGDTMPDDMSDNDNIINILTKYDPNFEGSTKFGGFDDGPAW